MTAGPNRIAPFSSSPKYHQLSSIIEQQIQAGFFAPHDAIPGERELEEKYNVSRSTVRQAIQVLTRKGVLYREHGKGTYVAPPKLNHSLSKLTSFTADMRQRGFKAGQRILEILRVEAPTRMAEAFQLPPDAPLVLRIDRVRTADNNPMGIHTTHLVLPEHQSISVSELEDTGSLYELLETRFNLIVAEADETLEATAADSEESRLLGVPEGSPLLLIERTTWSIRQEPIEYCRMLYRADKYSYYVHMDRAF